LTTYAGNATRKAAACASADGTGEDDGPFIAHSLPD
jgi:hypothetical protein